MDRQKTVVAWLICCMMGWASVLYAVEEESLFSGNTASLFIKHATEIYEKDPLDDSRTEQAMIFLEAAAALDMAPDEIPEKVLRIGSGSYGGSADYSNKILWALDKYLDSGSDMEVVLGALRSLLDRVNSRMDREVLLDRLFRTYYLENAAFGSELATQMGLLAIEKADTQSALNHMTNASQLNPYNQMAFSKLWEIGKEQGVSLLASTRIIKARMALEANPYDLGASVRYADLLLEHQVYQSASKAYAYAAQVYEFLYPERSLPDDVVQNWLLSCYHAERMQTKCLGLTETYRTPERFNLVLEAVAGKTLIKLGRLEEAKQLLESAAQKAEAIMVADDQTELVYPEYLAWFYSFVLDQPEKALAWSNQALVADPNRQGVGAMFAYTLVMSGQSDLAEQYVEPVKSDDPIAAVSWAMILLSRDQKQQALDALREAIAIRPESFVAEKAIEILKSQGSDYIPPDSLETIQTDIEARYGGRVVPLFVSPSDRCSVKLLFNGSDFLYGSDFPARLVIENTSDETLVISDYGFLKGYLHIDAVLEGHLNLRIPNLLSLRFRPSQNILPGKYLTVPLELNSGRLSRILMTYPQADLRIHFTVYLDPVSTETGSIRNQMKGLKPVQAHIRRRGVVMTRDFLLQRLDVLSKGQRGQKYRASSLFTGLLAEQIAVNISGADSGFVRVEKELLTGAIRKMLSDNDWKIRVHTLSALLSLSIPLDDVIQEVSDNLNHEKWPIRLTALVLLTQAQPTTFSKVLDWTAEHDPYALNRRMALALGGQESQPTPDVEVPELPQ